MWLWLIVGGLVVTVVVVAFRFGGSSRANRRPITLSDPNLFGVCSICRNHGDPKKIGEYRYEAGSSTYYIGLCAAHARRGYVIDDDKSDPR